MTQGAKGRGDNASPAKPSPLAELRQRWPCYAKPLRFLERARLPVGADKLRLAQKMIEACENSRGAYAATALRLGLRGDAWGGKDHIEAARDLKSEAQAARKAARDLARFLRRHEGFPSLPSALAESVWRAASVTIEQAARFEDRDTTGAEMLKAQQQTAWNIARNAGLGRGLEAWGPLFLAAILESFAQSLPRIATSGAAHRTRHGILFGASLLRKGRATDPVTACLFAVVFHARQATGPARDAWVRNESAAIFGPMPKEGSPLYKIAAAFVCAAFKLPETTLAGC
ncbi:MAG: hypothetical protein ACK4Y5_16530 [Acetobacteraceae bacterium]|jgi:hypothetical protein